MHHSVTRLFLQSWGPSSGMSCSGMMLQYSQIHLWNCCPAAASGSLKDSVNSLLCGWVKCQSCFLPPDWVPCPSLVVCACSSFVCLCPSLHLREFSSTKSLDWTSLGVIAAQSFGLMSFTMSANLPRQACVPTILPSANHLDWRRMIQRMLVFTLCERFSCAIGEGSLFALTILYIWIYMEDWVVNTTNMRFL